MTNLDPPPDQSHRLGRTCGSCYACCVWLGIKELKKWPTVACHHLDGKLGPTTRCGIYPTRPSACQKYRCAWVEGAGLIDQRPDKSGLLVTPYPADPEGIHGTPSPDMHATVIVTDRTKCGTLHRGPLHDMVKDLITVGFGVIQILSFKDKAVVFIRNGLVYKAELLQARSYEDLSFKVFEPSIGSYVTLTESESESPESQPNQPSLQDQLP